VRGSHDDDDDDDLYVTCAWGAPNVEHTPALLTMALLLLLESVDRSVTMAHAIGSTNVK
jgi:hypothetical protein